MHSKQSGLKAKQWTSSGKTLHYYLNYSSDPQTLTYQYGVGSELLQQIAVRHGQSMTLNPWDTAIIEEK